MKFYVLISLLIIFGIQARANDTLRFLSEAEFINIVRSYHPVAKQANLMVERAIAELLASRAGFDPQLFMSTDRKTFDGTNYYNYNNLELRIPTWYGIEVKAGLENDLGDNKNPESTTGKSSYLGVSVPLAKNLLMDKRRAVLMQSRIFRDLSKAERLLIINDLLIDSYASYWEWVKYFEVYKILDEVATDNEIRFNLVKMAFRQGDRPAMDTTEALAQLQSFQLARNDAWLSFVNAGFELSNFLWLANDVPYNLSDVVAPDSSWKYVKTGDIPMPVLDDLLTLARSSHPKLQSFDYKLQILDIERRLRFQNILPSLNVNYNILNSGYNVFADATAGFYRNNYKFGIDFGVPLRLSQGRGEYRSAKIKIQETNLDLAQTRVVIDNKVRYYFNELTTLQSQVRIAEGNLSNFRKLFTGENMLYRAGESSLFMLNMREIKLLESLKKVVELKTSFFKSYQSLQWAAGQLK
jgi:outer membrane protein TolC